MFSVMQVVDQCGKQTNNSWRYKFYEWHDVETTAILRSEKWLRGNEEEGDENKKYWEPIILDVAE